MALRELAHEDYQGNRILIALKSAEDPFEEVFIPAGLQSFSGETPAGGSVAL